MLDRRIPLGALICLWIAPAAYSQIRMTTGKALQLAFPGCKVQRSSVALSDEQRASIKRLSGQEFAKAMVFPYIAKRAGKVIGTAWFDVHRVRCKKQLLMVAVDPQLRVQRVEVLAFSEPQRYAAPRPWLRKFHTRRIGELRPQKDIPRITGAPLTVTATMRCVRRTLALHQVVFGAAPGTSQAEKKKPKAIRPENRRP